MLVLANLCNIGLAVFGNMYHENNFATFLLAILMSNLILYTFFYIVMKVCTSSSLYFRFDLLQLSIGSQKLLMPENLFSFATENGFSSHPGFTSSCPCYFGEQLCISS